MLLLRIAGGCAVTGILLVLYACGNTPADNGKPAPEPVSNEKAAPSPGAVTTMDADKMGGNIQSAAGTVAVVNLWATWCLPCVEETPEFARFYKVTKRADVTFISVSANAPETIDGEVKPFIEKNKLPFPVSVLTNANPEAMPLTLIYDRTGKLQKTLEEPITFDSLMALVKPLL
jgi:thiol-disulfide isomerase/thioredoxin